MIRACDVYDVLGLPKGLRIHMAGTVAVVKLIAGKKASQPPGAHDVALAMALHDVGNLVRPVGDGSLLGEPSEALERWKLSVAYARARYGDDEHAATAAMLGELGVRSHLIELIEQKSSENLHSILDRDDPVELLALYGDMRVGPAGVLSISERHEDAQLRHAGTNRKGLGGDITLEDLEELQRRVAKCFEFDPDAVSPTTAGVVLESCLKMDLGDAFQR